MREKYAYFIKNTRKISVFYKNTRKIRVFYKSTRPLPGLSGELRSFCRRGAEGGGDAFGFALVHLTEEASVKTSAIPTNMPEDAASFLESTAQWLPTINTPRKATGGLPDHQTPFDPHILRYEP